MWGRHRVTRPGVGRALLTRVQTSERISRRYRGNEATLNRSAEATLWISWGSVVAGGPQGGGPSCPRARGGWARAPNGSSPGRVCSHCSPLSAFCCYSHLSAGSGAPGAGKFRTDGDGRQRAEAAADTLVKAVCATQARPKPGGEGGVRGRGGARLHQTVGAAPPGSGAHVLGWPLARAPWEVTVFVRAPPSSLETGCAWRPARRVGLRGQ